MPDLRGKINPPRRCIFYLLSTKCGRFYLRIRLTVLSSGGRLGGFISVAPLAKHYDFSFLAPCPASGLFINGEKDTVTPPEAVHSLVSKLKTQKGIAVEHRVIPGANHFFQDKIDELTKICSTYLDKRLAAEGQL